MQVGERMLYLHANLQLMFDSSVICIGGLPGIGSVGKVAADYLATALECSTAKHFFSKGFPAQAVVTGNVTSLLHAELKAVKIKDRNDLFVLSGDAQPLEIKEMYSLAGDILEYARSHKVTDIITLAAYVGDSKEKVMGAPATQRHLLSCRRAESLCFAADPSEGLTASWQGWLPFMVCAASASWPQPLEKIRLT